MLRGYESTHPPTPPLKRSRGDRCPSLFLITKHLLLAILFLMVIWTLLEILLVDQKASTRHEAIPAEATLQTIHSIDVLGRALVVALCVFGIFGMIRESFSLSLVFSVFMFVRLIAILYIPHFNHGLVSTALICLVTLMSFLFLALVRRTTEPVLLPPPANSFAYVIESIRI